MSYQPPPPWPPQQPRQVDEEKAGLFKAGKIAIWMWVALTIVIIAIPIVCCGFCGLGSVIGAATPDPTPYP